MINSRDIDLLHATVKRGAEEFLRRCKLKGLNVLITATYRDNEYQNSLYAQGRTKPGLIVTNAKSGQSMHNYKLAFDICKNVKGKEYSDTAFFKNCGAIWEEMGGVWGGSWKGFVDMPHLEFTGGLTLKQLRAGKVMSSDFRMRWEGRSELVIGGDEVIEDISLIINGHETVIKGIFKDGQNYPSLKDLAKALGITAVYDEVRKMPVLTK